jgi:O-antigen/teichoic acid export membrane protein
MDSNDGSAGKPFRSDKIEKSALNLYLTTLVGSSLGYIYWIIASRLIGPEGIGLLSSALGLSIMLVNLASLGIPLGIQRLLGKSLSENDMSSFAHYFRSGFVIISAGTAVVAAGVFLAWYLFDSLFSLELLVLCVILLPQSFLNIVRSPFVAMQNTRPLLVVTLASNTGKLALGTGLMLLGLGIYGAVAGYFVLFVGSTVGLVLILLRMVPRQAGSQLGANIRQVVSSGMPSWLPGTISAIGSQLGVVAVFGLQGASEAGIYFIAFSIMNFILAIPQSLIGALFPALSGKIQDPAKATSRTLVLSIAISLPIMSFITVYSTEVLSIFGEQYKGASFILVILMLSIIPYTIHSGIDAYFYARGKYRMATVMGVLSEIPKVALYIVLVPIFSGEGAAYSYMIGVVIGGIVSALVAVQTKTEINWKLLGMLTVVTGIVSYAVYISSVPWYVGLVISFIIIPILYTRLKLVTRKEISELLEVFPMAGRLKTRNMELVAKILFG